MEVPTPPVTLNAHCGPVAGAGVNGVSVLFFFYFFYRGKIHMT